MSTPIRPGGGVTPGTSSALEAGELEGSVGIDAARPSPEASAIAPTSGATDVSAVQQPTADLLARLDAGQLTRSQAVDALVAQALEAQGVANLPQAQRTELESVLRAALQDDPVLGELLGR